MKKGRARKFLGLALVSVVGSFVGVLSTLRPKGLGIGVKLVVGLFAALIGGLLFDWMGLDLGSGMLEIEYEDLLVAFPVSLAATAVDFTR